MKKLKEILLVDDKIDIQEMLADFLRNKSCSVDVCASGGEAMRYLEEKDYDLIVTDLIMPGLDGFSFVRKTREKNETPILVITGGSQSFDFQNGLQELEGQVFEILRKPFTKEKFWDAVNAALSSYGSDLLVDI